jgi:hypothetical protein
MWGNSTPNCEKINWEENGEGEFSARKNYKEYVFATY